MGKKVHLFKWSRQRHAKRSGIVCGELVHGRLFSTELRDVTCTRCLAKWKAQKAGEKNE